MKLGYEIKTDMMDTIVTRITKETEVSITISRDEDDKMNVNSGISFLDHMIDTMAWRANFNIGVNIIENTGLRHPVAEDIGITMGRTVLEMFKNRLDDGVEGYGYARGIIDEAFSDAAISFEGRANCFIKGPIFDDVDGMSNHDLLAFLEGFSQGCKCTLRIEYTGRDPHHSWEAVFRGLGLALKMALQPNIWMKGTISGLKGTLE